LPQGKVGVTSPWSTS